MSDPLPKKFGADRLGKRRRTAVTASRELVRISPPRFPLEISARLPGVRLVDWAEDHHELVREHLNRGGAVLFRGFVLDGLVGFADFLRAVSGEPLPYSDRATPRHPLEGNVYTSTDYASDQAIELHNESCYAWQWPLHLAFFCVVAAEEGGETPVADCRRVLARLDPDLVRRFEEQGVAYQRNFGEGLGIPWRVAFGVEEREELESLCRKQRIEYEWREGGRLRTRQVRPAVARHPHTGERSWFNQAVAFHASTLDPAIRETLLTEYGPEELPKNSFYGDGTPIEPETLAEIREAYREETSIFGWRAGDVLLLDNLLAAHGRNPFRGRRQVAVAMAEPRNWGQLG